ncbi:glycerate kinase [Alloscardovia macacae]|uniref:Glycerate kinase n=1 Tax=Alloscardovia macacae TaxID=1160091 RepID=A0A261F3K9_9BIFI|nr:glycerate kinase [Alloscardovia macacae]OZG53717.1 glycerate kinase [Alloscardovia macacae]
MGEDSAQGQNVQHSHTDSTASGTNRPRTVLVASDSFKGSASSAHVAELLEQGVHRVLPDALVKTYSIADGGEGTVDAVVRATGCEVRTVQVQGPLGEPVEVQYALLAGEADGSDASDDTPKRAQNDAPNDVPNDTPKTAVLEMAQSSGITLIEQTPENALHADTYGVGQAILDALDQGATRIFVGLGGSATSDGGMGMARALGVRFLDAQGDDVPRGLAGLQTLASVDVSGLDPRVAHTEFVALTDVNNPLTGACGAVQMYGAQKGLDMSRAEEYDGWMRAYAAKVAAYGADGAHDVSREPGAGAAGGLGAGLLAFCSARVLSGIDAVLDLIALDEALDGVDFVITGEGRMDAQSARGKAPVGVASRARARGIPVVAVVGARAEDLGEVYDEGIDLVIPLPTRPMTLAESMASVDTTLPLAAETATRAFLFGRA